MLYVIFSENIVTPNKTPNITRKKSNGKTLVASASFKPVIVKNWAKRPQIAEQKIIISSNLLVKIDSNT